MNSGSNLNAQQKWPPIVLRFPEKYRAHRPAKSSYKATILFFPHRRSSGILLTMSQQPQSNQSEIAKWLTFKIRKIADNNWQVRARLGSRDEAHHVASFTSEGQALEWIASSQADEWLQGRALLSRRQGSRAS